MNIFIRSSRDPWKKSKRPPRGSQLPGWKSLLYENWNACKVCHRDRTKCNVI